MSGQGGSAMRQLLWAARARATNGWPVSSAASAKDIELLVTRGLGRTPIRSPKTKQMGGLASAGEAPVACKPSFTCSPRHCAWSDSSRSLCSRTCSRGAVHKVRQSARV